MKTCQHCKQPILVAWKWCDKTKCEKERRREYMKVRKLNLKTT